VTVIVPWKGIEVLRHVEVIVHRLNEAVVLIEGVVHHGRYATTGRVAVLIATEESRLTEQLAEVVAGVAERGALLVAEAEAAWVGTDKMIKTYVVKL